MTPSQRGGRVLPAPGCSVCCPPLPRQYKWPNPDPALGGLCPRQCLPHRLACTFPERNAPTALGKPHSYVLTLYGAARQVPLVAIEPVGFADNVTLADPVDKGEGRFHAALPSNI